MPRLLPSSVSSPLSKPSTFNDRFCFVDIQRLPSALELAAYAIQREMPELHRCVGNALVDKANYWPIGFAVCYYEPCGTVSVHAHFGDYFRTYPKDILAGMAPVCQLVKDSGVAALHAVADEDISGSIDLVRWMGGEKTGERRLEPPIGDVYIMRFDNPQMTKWLERRGRARP